jgi:hypothetical protein
VTEVRLILGCLSDRVLLYIAVSCSLSSGAAFWLAKNFDQIGAAAKEVARHIASDIIERQGYVRD